jgi:hypothetical protein
MPLYSYYLYIAARFVDERAINSDQRANLRKHPFIYK